MSFFAFGCVLPLFRFHAAVTFLSPKLLRYRALPPAHKYLLFLFPRFPRLRMLGYTTTDTYMLDTNDTG